MIDTKEIIDSYLSWIKDNTAFRSLSEEGVSEITTPLLDRRNDHLQIYVKKRGNNYILTDDGYTIEDLKMSGMDIGGGRREKIFKTILNGFGVKSDNDELYIEATPGNIGQKKHYFLQAILAVNDMYTLSRENVYSLFKEDVELFFKSNDVIYTKDIKLTGKSGYDQNIDFLISATRNKPERLVKTINSPNKDSVMSALFTLSDVTSVREQEVANYIIYNDTDKIVSPEVSYAIKSYGVKEIPWSQREKSKQEFAIV